MNVPLPVVSWMRDNFEISTDPALIPLDDLNKFFASTDMPWAKPLPISELRNLVQRSLCFAVYEIDGRRDDDDDSSSRQRKLIGFGRWITDMVTVAYLTDVYLLADYRAKGLAKWMMVCVDEMFKSMPHLRGIIMIADRGSRAETLYRKHLAMDDVQSPGILLDRKGHGAAT